MSEADGAARIGRPAESDDAGWIKDYRAWRRGRLKGVQASAGVWLGLLTTLLTLLGSVVLFKGGDLVTSVTPSGWFQFFLILLVSLVFVSAILALIAGGAATWGGLGDIPELGVDCDYSFFTFHLRGAVGVGHERSSRKIDLRFATAVLIAHCLDCARRDVDTIKGRRRLGG